MKKRAGPASIPADFLNQLASYLHTLRDTGRCDTPIPLSELERLADGAGDPEARERAWHHLAGCVFCLNAYTELRGAAMSLQELGAASAPAAPAAAEAHLPEAPLDDEQVRRVFKVRLKALTAELQGVLRTWQHRAVQRHWSDPAEGIDWRLDLIESPRPVPSLAEPPGPDILGALERAERRAEEQLEEIRTVKRLMATSEDLVRDILSAGLADDVKSEQIAELESQRTRLLGLLRRAGWRARRE
jgi:hypothetical protein